MDVVQGTEACSHPSRRVVILATLDIRKCFSFIIGAEMLEILKILHVGLPFADIDRLFEISPPALLQGKWNIGDSTKTYP